jgi:hypothetical protein
MELELFAVAENVIVDQFTNQLTIVNVLEGVGAEKFPVQLSRLHVATLLRLVPEDFGEDWQAVIRVASPGAPVPASFALNFQVVEGSTRQRLTHRIDGLPAFAEGQITFELLINGKHFATHVLDVRLSSPQAATLVPMSMPTEATDVK